MASAVQELKSRAGGSSAELGLRRVMTNILRKGTLAVMDQALFSGANFVVSIMLARWLAPAEYGAYSVAFSVFLLFASLHMAIVIEPMMVFGAGKYGSRFPSYLRALLAGHLGVMVPASGLLFCATFLLRKLYSARVEEALRGLVFAAAAIL